MLRGCAYLFDVRVVEYVCMGGYKDHVGCSRDVQPSVWSMSVTLDVL